ncbi:MAG TPA: HIT family protein [Ktedonobacterales bacterium]|jgi:diadenosine tetraphosphate (Ap4A) HIT family hydrolase
MGNAPTWTQERAQRNAQIAALQKQSVCYICHDFATGAVFGGQTIIYDDDLFRVVLDDYPRMLGHTIVVYKPHREDISALSEEDAGQLFGFCTKLIRAIKAGLGAEKVYLNTMCDGGITHLHLQLFPRYPGDPIGSARFVAPRGPLTNGETIAQAIQEALHATR